MAKKPISIEALKHDATRINIPTAEFESLMREEDKSPVQVAYERRNRDLDPQLVWRGKDEQDWSDLIVQAPPLYVQEKLHPKALIDDLKRQTKVRKAEADDSIPDLFADFNGLPDKEAVTEFYQHDLHWSNRMILGDSLSVMASFAEREGLRGQVQCVYFDPPYGIKFNSNWQPSTKARHVEDGKKDSLTREPEVVRAFRDTWSDGIHSYLSFIRDRLTVARDLLRQSGSIFVQIGDENQHLLRSILDEVFGADNFVSSIVFAKTVGSTSEYVGGTFDVLLWYAKSKPSMTYRPLFKRKTAGGEGASAYTKIELPSGLRRAMTAEEKADPDEAAKLGRIMTVGDLTSARVREGRSGYFPIEFQGREFLPPKREWSTHKLGTQRLVKANRVAPAGSSNLGYVRFLDDFPVTPLTNLWPDTMGQNQFGGEKIYVVQTQVSVVQRCLLMTTDPGDLVLDPTCGSGTTAYVAEQWARRWITIDTSRVSLALARSRLMAARYPFYLLADSREGQLKEAEIRRLPPKDTPTANNVRLGFVYERVPHVGLRSIANNAEIDEIWVARQPIVDGNLRDLNALSGRSVPWMEWEVPREADANWSPAMMQAHQGFWEAVRSRQSEIDASIAARAEFELLYDRPHENRAKVRVAGPFTVETLSPHRTLAVGPNDELINPSALGVADEGVVFEGVDDFAAMVLKNLRLAGVQQAHKEGRISFISLIGWPGDLICAEGRYLEGDAEKRAGIFIGPEFGTVSRPDLVAAAREAGDAGFDVLVACAFNYDAHSAEFSKLGRVPVLRARMNPDLHMAGDLAATGAGNLFVVFGEPDIKIEDAGKDADGADLIRVKVSGVDVFKPQTGEVVSEDTDGIALWMLDTDYNEESFFVRHAYFLGANDPYKALKTTLKAEIDEEAWSSLNSDTSRPFPKPTSGRIAVKVINHLGDEVMKVFEAR